MKCCGVDTYKDWAEYDSDYFSPYNKPLITDPIFRPDNYRTPSVPNSCCDPDKRLVMKIGRTFSFHIQYFQLLVAINLSYDYNSIF